MIVTLPVTLSALTNACAVVDNAEFDEIRRLPPTRVNQRGEMAIRCDYPSALPVTVVAAIAGRLMSSRLEIRRSASMQVTPASWAKSARLEIAPAANRRRAIAHVLRGADLGIFERAVIVGIRACLDRDAASRAVATCGFPGLRERASRAYR